jgi:endonuclease YncB( thermonuclease family)
LWLSFANTNARADLWEELRQQGWTAREVPPQRTYVVDGDTLHIDWNANGYTESHEKVRLLFVDTPELRDSHKGRDVLFGEPARQFLTSQLSQGALTLWTSPAFPRDHYQRTLGLLQQGRRDVNRHLIRQGHSPFDTRYQWPVDYERYAEAEAEAFARRRGIWSEPRSQRKYLQRLAREGRTVYAPRNRRFVERVWTASRLRLENFAEQFVRVEGPLLKRERRGRKIELLHLPNQIEVVVQHHEQHRVPAWDLGEQIVVEGWVKPYRGRWQVQFFRGWSPDVNGRN